MSKPAGITRYRPTNKPIGRLMEPHEYGDYIRADDPAILAAIEAMEYALDLIDESCLEVQENTQSTHTKLRLALSQLKGTA